MLCLNETQFIKIVQMYTFLPRADVTAVLMNKFKVTTTLYFRYIIKNIQTTYALTAQEIK